MTEEVVVLPNELIVEERKPVVTREKVNALEELMRQAPQVEIPVEHFFANAGTKRGTYARQITIPKDTVLTGKIHKYEQINIMTKGDLSVLTEEGIKRVQAPFVIVSPAGTKRVAYAHEETVWITIHSTDEIDIDQIEAQFIAQNDAEYLEFVEQLRIGEQKCLG